MKSRRKLTVQNDEMKEENTSGKNECSYLFKYLIFCNICLYLETGAVPALLVTLARQFDMGKMTQGLLGGIVYLALSVGGPLAGVCLTQYNSKSVLTVSLALCNTFCLCLACSPVNVPHAESLFIASRAFLGICQCFFCIFVPIWTDEYAPPKSRASWMGYMQASTPLSVMCGYLLASVSLWVDRRYEVSKSHWLLEAWRWPFFVQFLLMLFFCIGVCFVPAEHISLAKVSKLGPESPNPETNRRNIFEMVRTRFVNRSWQPIPVNRALQQQSLRYIQQRHSSSSLAELEISSPRDPIRRRNLASYTLQTSFVLPMRAKDSLIQSFSFDDAEVVEHMRSMGRKGRKTMVTIAEGSYQNSAEDLPSSQSEKDFSNSETRKYYMARMIESQRMALSKEGNNEDGIKPTSPGNKIDPERKRSKSASSGDDVFFKYLSKDFNTFSRNANWTNNSQPKSPSSKLLVQYTNGRLHFKKMRDLQNTLPIPEDTESMEASRPTLLLTEGDVSDLSSTLNSFGVVPEKDAPLGEQIRSLFSNRVYVAMVFTISALYFVVTGIQFWGTAYMLTGLGGSEYVVNILFMITAASAPTLGVFFGGATVDRIGGYKGLRQRIKALRLLVLYGCLAMSFAVPTTFFTNLYIVVVFLWLTLFFGASTLPTVTGIIISVVGRHQREIASSAALVIFNLLGYSMCPILSGFIMQYLADHYPSCTSACQDTLGMRFVLFWSSIAVVGSACALLFSEMSKRQNYLPVWNQDFEVVSPLPKVLLNNK